MATRTKTQSRQTARDVATTTKSPPVRKKPAARKPVVRKPAVGKPSVRKPATKAKKPLVAKRATPRRQTKPRRRSLKQSLSLTLTPLTLNWLMGGAALMILGGALLWLAVWINNPANLSIQRVDWQSEFRYLDRGELQALIEPHVQTNLYLLDEVALETTLENHPWIRAVSLRKAWPNELLLNVEEQLPIAFWGDNQLLNQFGEIFTAELPEKLGEFPMIHSPKKNGREMAERFISMSRSMSGLGLKIAELTEDDTGAWHMQLGDGQDVKIGRKEQEKRIERFRVGYARELRSRFGDVRSIDLRYTNGFAIEWKRGSKGAGAVSSLGQTLGNGNRGS